MNGKPIRSAGIMAFLFWRGKMLLILRDNKPNIVDPNTFCPITGGAEGDEDLESAAKRELLEEILFAPTDLKFLGVSRFGNGFFFGRLSDEDASVIFLMEGQYFRFFDFDELKNLELSFGFKIYLDRYTEIFRKMFEEDYEPEGKDFGLLVRLTPE